MYYKKITAAVLTMMSFGAVAVETELGEITVTGTREKTLKAETPATVGVVDSKEVEDVRPSHPSEIMSRIPGVHINVTGGEGHMTAIRQPLSTSPLYLYLEDGIPTRSTGFFNHNALYEVNIPQSGGIEVNKGPGTALYGSDAIGGVVNVMTRPSPTEAEASINVEAGENGWSRILLTGGDSNDTDGFRADLNLTHTDGWRDATDYDRQGVTLRWDRFMHSGATLKTVLSTSNIDQTTAGSSRLLKEDYENNPTANYTPISYREVQALRLSTSWEKETANSLLSITPYYRNNRMEYMPNWSFTYDPQISETENESLGLMLKYRYDIKPMRTRVITGMDIDYSPGSRLEKSIDATKVGNIYTSYVLKETIYDYDVSFTGVSPYVHVETSLSEKLRLTGGLRYDHIEYDYDNNLSDANIVLNPTSMTFPATYKHPSDTKVDFSHLSPKLGATYIFNKNLNGFASYRHSFRVPSEGQLFRPGKSNDTVSLEPVKIDSFEIGLRGKTANQFKYEVSLYHMTKDDDIITYVYADKSRESMNAGETLHRGIEIALGAPLNKRLDLDIAFSYAKHTYEDWNPEDGVDYSGNEMKSAPRLVANTRLNYRPAAFKGGKIELEWESLGSYWMNDANDYKYSGHDLFHLRGNYPLTKQVELYGRVMNITDERYATSAEYTSSGDFEYAPGMERTVYVGLNYKFK